MYEALRLQDSLANHLADYMQLEYKRLQQLNLWVKFLSLTLSLSLSLSLSLFCILSYVSLISTFVPR